MLQGRVPPPSAPGARVMRGCTRPGRVSCWGHCSEFVGWCHGVLHLHRSGAGLVGLKNGKGIENRLNEKLKESQRV